MMEHYLWNMLNNPDDLVFVVNEKTRDVVLKNNVYDELTHALLADESVELAAMMPRKEGVADPITDIIAFLDGKGEGAEYREQYTQQIFDRTVAVQMVAGYFEKSRGEIYFVFGGYRSLLDFIRFQKAISKIPENVVALELNDALSIYCVNDEFEQTFGAGLVAEAPSFQVAFGSALANAMPAEGRVQLLEKIKADIAEKGRAQCITMLRTVIGTQHYVMLTLKYAKDLLRHTVVCATVQVVDESVEKYLNLQNEHEVYTVASSFSNSVLFRLNLSTLGVTFFGSLVENFRLHEINGGHVQEILNNNLVLEEDIPKFHALVADMCAGVERIDRMRMHAKDGRCDWYMVEYKIAHDKNGKPEQALGKITNVQKHQELQERASLDLLTGCLNKGTFEASCMNQLYQIGAPEAKGYAFFIIDLDDFKLVNDNLGHYLGDTVLREVGQTLKSSFRATDEVARIGGDEFAVLMKGVTSPELATRKAAELVQSLNMCYQSAGAQYRVSVSVGVALYPQHAANYQDLYRRADEALYQAKHVGKHAHQLYQQPLA